MKVDVFDVTCARRDLLGCSVSIDPSDSKVPSLVRTVNSPVEKKKSIGKRQALEKEQKVRRILKIFHCGKILIRVMNSNILFRLGLKLKH